MNGWVLVAGDFVSHGGMDRANLELARFLAADYPVHLVTHRAANDIAVLQNVTVHRVTRPFGRHILGQPLLGLAGRRWARRLPGHRVIVNGANCRWPDVNWVHYVHAAAPPVKSRGWLRRAISPIEVRLARRAERRALGIARLVICNSRRTARDVVERVGVCPDRVKVVYLGTDAREFALIEPTIRSAIRSRLGWEQRPWVSFIGALGDTRKGFDRLYTAWRELCKDPAWDANLVVVGAGPSLGMWRRHATADGLDGRVKFLGLRKDVPDILAASDLLVHPARYEPYGLAVHEALCRGIPAIVSAVAGIAERYPPSLADLILDDPAALVDRLRHWRATIDSFSARIRPFADELRSRSWTDMARDIRDAILET